MVESNISANDANKFSVSLLAFWVKGSMSVDQNFLHINMPNTVLFGLIPAGKRKENTPLQGVSQVETNNSFKLGAMIFGVIIALAGIAGMQESGVAGLILLLIGILMFLSGIKTRLSFERNGVRQSIDVPFFEGSKISEFADKVTNELTTYQVDRNNRIQTENQTSALNAQSAQNTQAIINAVSQNNGASTQTAQANAADKSVQFCPNCGAKNSAEAAFCTSCGTKLK